MPWLLRDGEVLATLEVAESFAGRARGLLGRDGIDGALLLAPGALGAHARDALPDRRGLLRRRPAVVITTVYLERQRVCLPRAAPGP